MRPALQMGAAVNAVWEMKCLIFALLIARILGAEAAGAPKIDPSVRLPGPPPSVAAPVLFNTPQADAIVAAMQIMPVNSPWHTDVSRLPPLVNSDAMIAQIANDLAPARQTLRAFYEMNYVLVPDNQPTVPITFSAYPAESDFNGGVSPVGLYPIPPNLPIETWPRGTGAFSLDQWQQDVGNAGGDRHAIIVAPGAGLLYETWQTKRTNGKWQAANGAIFNLKTGELRPAGWTSADAAGLPIFPALVRYDECERGVIEHAMRLVIKRTRVEAIYPATHRASVDNATNPNVPAMGQRLRLKSGFVIPDGWTIEEKAVLVALKKYGALVADNGGFFSVSVCPDDRFGERAFSHLETVPISAFEAVNAQRH